MLQEGTLLHRISSTEYQVSALCAFGTFIAWRIIYGIFFSPLSHIPGPLLTAITPHYINFLSALNRRTIGTHSLHDRYGPIVRLSPREVSVLSSSAIKEVYSSPQYSKYIPLYSIFTHFGAQNAFTSCTREEHGWRRKAISETYSLSYVLKDESATGKILKVIKDYLSFVERDRRVDIYSANTFYATDVVTGKIFGAEASMKTLPGNEVHRDIVLGYYARTRRTKVWLYIEFPLVMNIFEWFAFYSGRVWSWMCGEKVEGWEMVSSIQKWGWDAYMDAKLNCHEDAVVRRLAGLVQDGGNTEGTWDDKGVVSEVMDQMLAGMDTTSDTLSFLIYQLSLAESGDVQKKLHSELFDAFPSFPGVEYVCWPNAMDNDVQSISHETLLKVLALPYLDAVLKETLRVYTAIPITLPRVVPSSMGTGKASGSRNGRVIEGKFVPAGTTIGTFAYGIHRDNAFAVETKQEDASENVDSFIPERWLVNGGLEEALTPDDLAQEKQRVRTMESRLWAFGSGGRNCVGKHLAILEMKLLLATIFWRYQTRIMPENSGIKIRHNRWNEPRTFRDVLPFRGVDGVVTFIPYNY